MIIFMCSVLFFLFVYYIYYQYYKIPEQKESSYFSFCSDFNCRIINKCRSILRCRTFLSIKESEISKLGLALIGKNILFGDERDAYIKEMLQIYEEGEYFFIMFMAGDPLKDKEAAKFYNHLQYFKEAWLKKECEFLFRGNQRLLQLLEKEILNNITHGLTPYEIAIRAKYYEIFDKSYNVQRDLLGSEGYPLDDYRNHEDVKELIMKRASANDRASSYEFIFWWILEGNLNFLSTNNASRISLKGRLFYNLIRYLWIIFTESCLPLIDNHRLYCKAESSLFSHPDKCSAPIPNKNSNFVVDKNKIDDAIPSSEDLVSAVSEETSEQRLMSIGLASIGRKTRMMNKYMTAERIETRRRIEYPFLKLLADRYKDEKQRKILSRHFMLFKEMCLFISLGVILRDKKREHEQVKTDLTNRLSDGLTVKARDWRDGYWRILTKNFYDSYTENKDIGQSLSQSFWGALSMKYPEILIMEDIVKSSAGRLNEIFRYIYGSMMKEHE